MASFFYCGRLSSAQLVQLQAPKHRPIMGPHLVEQTAFRRDIKDNGYKSVFTNLCLELQWNRSWIKGLGKNPQKSELIHWQQCLLSGGTEACSLGFSDSKKYRRVYSSSNDCRSHEWRVDMATGRTVKNRNAKMAGLTRLRSEGVNNKKMHIQ